MRFKNLFLWSIFCIMCCSSILLFSCTNKEEETRCDKIENDIRNTKLLIYPSAKNVDKKFSAKYCIKSVKYNAKIKYPATALIAFYDQKMKNSNYKLLDDKFNKNAQRKWNYYEDGRLEGNPYVAAISISWADTKRRKRANLIVRYYYKNDRSPLVLEKNDNCRVIYQIMPYGQRNPTETREIRVGPW